MKKYIWIIGFMVLIACLPVLGQWDKTGGGSADDAAYDAGTWDGNLDAPTKNAVRDKIETVTAGATGVDEAYASGWNSDASAPEKDDIYDYLHFFDADDDHSFTDETWFTNALGVYLANSVYDANTIISANSDNTPGAVEIGEQRVLGRVTSGNIAALTLGNAATNVAQWPADPAAHTLFGFDNTGNIYRPIVIGATLSYDQASNTVSVATAPALSSNPSDCGAGEFANAIAANGDLTCAAPVPTNITPVDTADENATFYPILVDGATGSQATETDAELTYNPSTDLFGIPNLSVTTQFKVPSSNADPTATAGYFRHDSTISNFTNGGLVYYNGAAIKQLIDMTTATASGCTDDYVVAYDADNDLWYCKADANSGSLSDLDDLPGDTIDNNLIDQAILEGYAPSTSPGFTAFDSDSAGADKTAGFIGWQYVEGADGAENSDWLVQIMQGGTLTTILSFDESDDQFETSKMINSSGGFTGALTGTASVAATGDSATSFFGSGTIEAARLPAVSGSTAGIIPTTSGITDGYIPKKQSDGSVLWAADATGAGGDQLVDIVATTPLLVNGTTNVDNALPGSDADVTFSLATATLTKINRYHQTAHVDPNEVYSGHAGIIVMDPKTAGAITITDISVYLDENPTTELTVTCYHKTAAIGYTGGTTIDANDTADGTFAATSSFDDATIPSGSKVWCVIGDDPDATNTDMEISLTGTYD